MAWGAPRGVDDLIAKLNDNSTVRQCGCLCRGDCEFLVPCGDVRCYNRISSFCGWQICCMECGFPIQCWSQVQTSIALLRCARTLCT